MPEKEREEKLEEALDRTDKATGKCLRLGITKKDAEKYRSEWVKREEEEEETEE